MNYKQYSKLDLVRAIGVLAAVYLTAGLLWVLPSPGFGVSRLVFSAIVIAIAWVGAVGALRHRPSLVVAGAVGLLLFGFWQAVLWIFMLPAAAILLVVATILWRVPTD